MVSATVSLCDCICTKTCTPIYAHTHILCIYCCVYWYQKMHAFMSCFQLSNIDVYSVCHVDVFEPISHISKPIGCAPKRGAAETSSPGQASIGANVDGLWEKIQQRGVKWIDVNWWFFLTQMTGWEWRILVGWVSPYQFSEASKDPNLSNHVNFEPSSFQTTCCCRTLEHTSGNPPKRIPFYNPFLGRFDWVVHLPPASGDIIRKEPVGCPGWWPSAMPSITPFSAMAKAASPPLRPWFSSRSWYLFNEQKL